LLLVSNKKLAYLKTSHYLTIISLFPDYVQRFFVDQPRADSDGQQNAREQKPRRSPQFFVQKPAAQRQRHERRGDGIAKVPSQAEGGPASSAGKKLFVGFVHKFVPKLGFSLRLIGGFLKAKLF